MAQTVLGNTIGFLATLGVYDVVLPFLLVFVLMFAFLEKTKVLGLEVIKSGDKEIAYSRKNLNAIIAFTSAFFVIASSELVRILSEVVANTMLLVVTGTMFMLAIGITHTGKGEFDLDKQGLKKYKSWFLALNAIGILLIFLNALGWLDLAFGWLKSNWNSAYGMTLITILVFVGFIFWVTKSPSSPNKDKDDKDD
ncbi:MAG: hypothetical protein U9R00_02660 [Patescibacteria group bacterium]|nr:hypothetical protein [Patescibacteria group bacterium]